jgi:hypothetical protein
LVKRANKIKILGGQDGSNLGETRKQYQVSDDEENANNASEDCESYKSSEGGYVGNNKYDDDNESTNLDVQNEKF